MSIKELLKKHRLKIGLFTCALALMAGTLIYGFQTQSADADSNTAKNTEPQTEALKNAQDKLTEMNKSATSDEGSQSDGGRKDTDSETAGNSENGRTSENFRLSHSQALRSKVKKIDKIKGFLR